MLSRFVRKTVLSSHSTPLVTCQRFFADEDPPWYTKVSRHVRVADGNDPSKIVSTEIDDFVPRPIPLNGPQRDHVNFPKPKRLDKPVPTRLGMFPESWFKYMYPKLGVTGPYTLGIGIFLFLVNKEIYLIEDYEFQHTMAFFAWIYIIIKSPIGLMVRDLVYGGSGVDEAMDDLRRYNEELRLEAIAFEKEEQWRLEGKKLLFNAKKENVGLQLEASYRKSLMDVYNQLKRRLDYQVEVTKIDERIKQQFMVKWVLDRVNESISQTSEKENLKQCIANLNLLAARV